MTRARGLGPACAALALAGGLAAAASCGRAPSRAPLSPRPAEPERREAPSAAVHEEPTARGKDGGARDAAAASPDPRCAVREHPPLDCPRLKGPPGALCTGAIVARRACETLGADLDAEVAAAWMDCLGRAAGTTALCETRLTFDCGLEAARRACEDEAVAASCAELVPACAELLPEWTPPVCRRVLGAFRLAARERLEGCLRHACATGDFGACLP